jgi:hypothetical protein
MRPQKKSRKKEEEYTMPVAPDEPTYVTVEMSVYGEMIACENEVLS